MAPLVFRRGLGRLHIETLHRPVPRVSKGLRAPERSSANSRKQLGPFHSSTSRAETTRSTGAGRPVSEEGAAQSGEFYGRRRRGFRRGTGHLNTCACTDERLLLEIEGLRACRGHRTSGYQSDQIIGGTDRS